jgi:hypothetical protein
LDDRIFAKPACTEMTINLSKRSFTTKEISFIYYDPKDMGKAKISARYYECSEFVKRHCHDKITSGWKAIS